MDKNIFREFNPHFYERYLSPFGKKVLHVLVRRWNTRNDRSQLEQHRKQLPTQNRKVLTFNDSHAIHPTSTPLNNNYPCEIEKATNQLMLIQKNLPIVPTSVQLIETVGIKETNDLYEHESAVDRLPNEVSVNRSLINEQFPLAQTADNYANDITKNIDWSDMFDTDLFPTKVNLNVNSYLRNEHYKIPKSGQNDHVSNNSGTDVQPKKLKRKNQTKVTDAISKKVKIIKKVSPQNNENESEKLESKQINKDPNVKMFKHNFRKQKYSKTVKNWLNDVNPNNVVEEEIIGGGIFSNVDTCQQKKDITPDKSNIKTSTKAMKVVQARLANKDGVMKYSKPKVTKETMNTENMSAVIDKETSKEKKVKKFIAPIKSQIPVKDIVFQVRNVDSGNAKQSKELFDEVKNKEIYITLVFSNGFSQFNSQHTEDSCVSDTIIFCIDEIFYSFKGSIGFLETINHLLERNKIICYNGKPILVYLATMLQIEIRTLTIYDAQIGGSLLDPDNPPDNFSELQKLLGFTPQYTIATECTLQKAAWYMTLLKECWNKLSHQLMENSLWSVYVEIETRLLPIIANMEIRGVKIDLDKLRSMEELLLTKIKQVEQECYRTAGKVFQINSTMQVRAIIYDELQLDTKCNVQIRETMCKGAKSTSETMLRSLVSVHALPKLILEYRQLHKAHATFLAGIAHHAKDGVVRPTWVQMAAATGRIASNNPNLQAIPKVPFNCATSPNADNTDHQELNFRSVYVSREGYSLLAADFKHVECRVFAHAAADTGLLDILKSSEDLFRVLAAKWLNKPEAAVSSEDRERTKRIVYASLYGAGARRLMDILDLSYEQALAVTASFNSNVSSRTKRIVYASLYGAGARRLMDILDLSYEQALAVTASFNSNVSSRTKRIVYASLYGAGARRLMDILDLSYEQALAVTASFNSNVSSRTKRIVYASLYGAGARRLMDILDLSYEQALAVTASFNSNVSSRTKRIVYASLYGAGARRLMDILDLSYEQALAVTASFNSNVSSRTKRIVYASLYGAGARRLMDILDLSYEQALAVTASFNSNVSSRTKRIVYASLYGAGARRLMDILDLSYEQALAVTASFNSNVSSRTKRIVYASLYGAGARRLMDILDLSYEQALAVTASFNSNVSSRTKRIVYASLYGAGARRLMDILDLSYEQALAVTASFNRTFPSLKSFGRSVVSRCERVGRLATARGRMRRLRNIASADAALRAQAERQAVNFIVQGSAADLCKTAMILTEERLRSSSPPIMAHLILQLHDELVWEVEHRDLDRAADLIKRVMESCGRECGMAITLPVAVSTGTCWGQMAPLNRD